MLTNNETLILDKMSYEKHLTSFEVKGSTEELLDDLMKRGYLTRRGVGIAPGYKYKPDIAPPMQYAYKRVRL